MAEYYTSDRILTTVRVKMDDTVTPYFVEDSTLLDYFNRSLRDMAERRLFPTSREFRVSAAANEPWVAAPEQVVAPRELVRQSDGWTVEACPASAIEGKMYSSPFGGSDWRRATGRPDYIVPDMELGMWRWAPTPTQDEEFVVEGWKYLEPVTAWTVTPDVPDWLLEHVHLGILSRAFMIQDTDSIYDPKQGGEYELRWIEALNKMEGKRERDRRASGGNVRYGGY